MKVREQLVTIRISSVLLVIVSVFLFRSSAIASDWAERSSSIKNLKEAALIIHAYRNGDAIGSGTAFEVTASTPGGKQFSFVITAGHVVAGANRVLVKYPYSNGERWGMGEWGSSWIDASNPRLFSATAPDDAVAIWTGFAGKVLSTSNQDYGKSIWLQNATIDQKLFDLEPLSTHQLPDIFVTGFPWALENKDSVPITRRCTVALESTVGLHFGNEDEFLIDCATLPGDSGAPVFSRDMAFSSDGRVSEIDTKFVGILLGSFTNDQAYDLGDEVVTKKFKSGFSRVLSSRAIDRLIRSAMDKLIKDGYAR